MSNKRKLPDLWEERQDFIAGLRHTECPVELGAAVLLVQWQRGRLSLQEIAAELPDEMAKLCTEQPLVGHLAFLAAALARLQPDQAHLILELSTEAFGERPPDRVVDISQIDE